jgi:uncharacterized protein with von Willebrand factor type A (vWA) domain
MNASNSDFTPATLAKRLTEFIDLLRRSGLAVGSSEFLDAAEALIHVDFSDAKVLRECLRATLIKRPDFYAVFESLFDSFWLVGRAEALGAPFVSQARRHGKDTDEKHNPELAGLSKKGNPPAQNQWSLARRIGGYTNTPHNSYGAAVYSGAEILSKKSFGNLEAKDKYTLKRNLKLLSKRLATLNGRRPVRSLRGDVDLKETLKRGLKYQGEILKIVRRRRRKVRSRIVFLCDISSSMDFFENKLFEIMYYVSNTFPHTKVFGFSTGLVRLDGFLRGKSLVEAADCLSMELLLWGSGTRIGESFDEFLDRYPYALDPRTSVVVVSDGWDLGDKQKLNESLSRLKRKVNAFIWINPLADDPSYQPITPAMLTALQYTDLFDGTRILFGLGESVRALSK